jgi:hypothetical protein
MNEFTHGALMAVSLLIATHDQPVMAADVLNALSLHDADCSELDEYDKRNLRKAQGELQGKISLRGLN